MTEPLPAEEKQLIELLLEMTGREERMLRAPYIEPVQAVAVRAIWPFLKRASETGMESHARCDLLNRLLLTLGIKTVALDFFDTVFGETDFAKLDKVAEQVERFRILCMLEYGNFRFGYKKLGRSPTIRTLWMKHFPGPPQAAQQARQLRERPAPIGLISIEASS